MWCLYSRRTLQLALAYETLKDEVKRREYDCIYPSIKQSCGGSSRTQAQPRSAAPAGHSEPFQEAAKIAALRKSKEERGTRWSISRQAFVASIAELQKHTQRLEQDIKNLASIAAAEAAEEARKNSWGTWLLSPFSKQISESENDKARKDRERQERRIEKDLKERRLVSQKARLLAEQNQFQQAEKEKDAADLWDEQRIRIFETMARDRETRERLERERLERERLERLERERLERILRQEQEQREREAREARDAARRLREEARANNPRSPHDDGSARRPYTTACTHAGWWSKVQSRTACPECYDVWNYLLKCPSCVQKACPKCQRRLRPRSSRHTAWPNRREPWRA